MKRTLVALAVLASLTACGTSTASTGLTSPTAAQSTPSVSVPPSSTGCQSGHVDVDVVVQAGPGDWTGSAQGWCLGTKTQVEVAKATYDAEVFAGQTPQCQIIAADPKDDQLTTWGQGPETTKPRLINILATFGNC